MRPGLLPAARLVRSTGAWWTAAGWSALVLSAAWFTRRHGESHGATEALDSYASIAVPLLTYGLAVAASPGGLAVAARPLVRLGARPASVAAATVLWALAICGVASGGLGAATVALAHGAADPPAASDALQTFAFGGLAGSAYAAYFLLGSSLLTRAPLWGSGAFLVLDWALGSDDGLGALFTPRAHLRNLLGGEAPFDALPWQSLVALGAMVVVCAGLAIVRASRARL